MKHENDDFEVTNPALERLFIYGSLAPDCPNHHIVSHIRGRWLPGTVKGHLVEQGWGAAMGFTGIIISDSSVPKQLVKGMVLESGQLGDNWPMLDDFEGEQYERVFVPVKLDSGEEIDAYIYQLKQLKSKENLCQRKNHSTGA